MSKFLQDAVERVVATFVVVFLTALLATPAEVWTADTAKKAGFAGAAAALTLVKTLVAKFVGNPDSASLTKTV